MTRLPSERERGAELNRILRGKTKPGIINSWPAAAFFVLSLVAGLVCWGFIGGVVWLLWRAL